MRQKSTTSNLFMQYLSKVKDKSGQVDVLFTDLAMAFDKVDHTFLCSVTSLLLVRASLS